MKVYSIAKFNISHKQSLSKRIIRGYLNDGSTALIEMNVDKNLKIHELELFQLKKGKVLNWKFLNNEKASDEDTVMSLFENLQEKAAEGVSFIGEFTRVMIGK